jgi:GTP pyrophosphokinase
VNLKEREDAADLGRKLLEKEARKFKTSWKQVLVMSELPQVLSDQGVQKTEDLYPEVGFGKIAPRQILSALFPDVSPLSEEKAKPSAISAVVSRVLGRGESPITVKGQDGLLVTRAKCCNPIRGDEIVGYITRGKGISVHTTSCPNVTQLMGSDRLTEVEWIDAAGGELFPVRLAISVQDRQGILADITSAISNLKTNIRESRSSADSGKGLVEVTIDIGDTRHLQKVIRALKSIRGIEDVDRVIRVN